MLRLVVFCIVLSFVCGNSYFLLDSVQESSNSRLHDSQAKLDTRVFHDASLYHCDDCTHPHTTKVDSVFVGNEKECYPLDSCYSFNTYISSRDYSHFGNITGGINGKRIENTFFVTTWIKPTSSREGDSCGTLIDFMYTTKKEIKTNYFGVYFPTCGYIGLYANGVTRHVNTIPTLNKDFWNHILFDYNGVTGSYKLYVNGTNVAAADNIPLCSFDLSAETNITYTLGQGKEPHKHSFIGAMNQIIMEPGSAAPTLAESLYQREFMCNGVAASNSTVCNGNQCVGFNQCSSSRRVQATSIQSIKPSQAPANVQLNVVVTVGKNINSIGGTASSYYCKYGSLTFSATPAAGSGSVCYFTCNSFSSNSRTDNMRIYRSVAGGGTNNDVDVADGSFSYTTLPTMTLSLNQQAVIRYNSYSPQYAASTVFSLSNSNNANSDLRCHVTVPADGSSYKGIVATRISDGKITCDMTALSSITSTKVAQIRVSSNDIVTYPNLFYSGTSPLTTTFIPDTGYQFTTSGQKILGNTTTTLSITLSNTGLNLDNTNAGYMYGMITNSTAYDIVALGAASGNQVFTTTYNFQNTGNYAFCLYIEASYPRTTAINPNVNGWWTAPEMNRYSRFANGDSSCLSIQVLPDVPVVSILPESLPTGVTVPVTISTNIYSAIYDSMYNKPWTKIGFFESNFYGGTPAYGKPMNSWDGGCSFSQYNGIYIGNTIFPDGTSYGLHGHSGSTNDMIFTITNDYDQFSAVFGVQNDYCNWCSTQTGYFMNYYVLANNVVIGGPYLIEIGNVASTNVRPVVLPLPDGTTTLTLRVVYGSSETCGHAVVGSPKLRRKPSSDNFAFAVNAYGSVAQNSLRCNIQGSSTKATWDGFNNFNCNMTVTTAGSYQLTLTGTSAAGAPVTLFDGYYYTAFSTTTLGLSTTQGNVVSTPSTAMMFYFVPTAALPTNIQSRIKCAITTGGIQLLTTTYNTADSSYSCTIPAYPAETILTVALRYEYLDKSFYVTLTTTVSVISYRSLSYKLDATSLIDSAAVGDTATIYTTSTAYLPSVMDTVGRIKCIIAIPGFPAASVNAVRSTTSSGQQFQCSYSPTVIGIGDLTIQVNIAANMGGSLILLTTNSVRFYVTPQQSQSIDKTGNSMLPSFNIASNSLTLSFAADISPLNNLIATGNNELNYTCVYGTNIYPAFLVSVLSSVSKWNCTGFVSTASTQTISVKIRTPLGINNIALRSALPYYVINPTSWSLTSTSPQSGNTMNSMTFNMSSVLNIDPSTVISSRIKCKFGATYLVSSVYTVPPNVMISCTIPQQSTPGNKSLNVVYTDSTNEFVVSNTPVVIPYTSTYNLTFASGTNTYYTTDSASVKITIDKVLDPSQAPRVKCNFTQPDATFALVAPLAVTQSSFYVFTCGVSASNSNNAGVGFVSLSIDAGGGQLFSISGNSLPIILVKKITLTTVTPFTTLITNQNTPVSIASPDINMYGSYVKYSCATLLPNSLQLESTATYSSSLKTYTCNIKSQNVSYASAISVYITSIDMGSNITLSTTAIPFYFTQTVSVTSFAPFILPYPQQSNVDVGFTPSTALPTLTSVYCTYQAVGDSNTYNTPVMRNITSGGVYCNIARQATMSNVQGSMTTINVNVIVIDSTTYTITLAPFPVQLFVLPSFVNELQALNATDLTRVLSLSFTVPADSLLSFKFQYSFGSITPKTLPCTFTIGAKPSCVFGTLLDPISLPQKMSTFVVVDRNQTNSLTATIAASDMYYIGNISIYSAMPWMADMTTYKSTVLNSKFRYTGPQLDSNYKYECVRTGSSGVFLSNASNIASSAFNCDVRGAITDDTVTIALRITSFIPSSVAATLLTLPASTVSITSGQVEFTTLTMSPTVNNFVVPTTHTLVRNSTGSAYVIPTQYQSYTLSMSLNTGTSDVWNCALVSNAIQCTSQALTVDVQSSFFPGGNVADMNTVNPTITTIDSGSTVTVMNIAKPILFYRRTLLKSSFARAALRGTPTVTTLKFYSSTFKFGSTLGTNTISCGSYYNRTWSGTVTAIDTLSCSITYDATQLVNNQVLYYRPLLNVPSVLGSQTVSTLDATSNNATLYYLDQKTIYFTYANQTQMFYTSQSAVVTITMIQANIPQELIDNGFIYCSVNTDNAISKAQATLISKTSGDYIFACDVIQTDPVTCSGTRTISLSYSDGTGYFDISSNKLDIIYIKKSGIISLQPLAVPVSSTTKTTVNVGTSFPTTYSYGNSVFYCQTGPRFGTLILLNATITSNGVFACVFNNTIPETWDINVLIYAKNTSLPLLQPNATLTFVDKFFLSPSYGLAQGNELTRMDPYDMPGGITLDEAHRIRFKINTTLSNYNFSCIDSVGIGGAAALNCTTIPLTFLPSFASYQMTIGQNNSLAMKWIIYESRTVNVVPAVFPIGMGSVNISLNLSGGISPAPEGSFQTVIAYGSSDVVHYDMGTTMGINNMVIIASMNRGSYPIAGYYYSPFSFELYGTMRITNIQQLHFIQRDKISFPVNNLTNIGYTNSVLVTQVQLADTVKLDSEVYFSTYCVFTTSGGIAVNFKARFIGNDSNLFECSILYTSAASGELTLWYIDAAKAYGGQVLLCSNSLRIAFVEPLIISTSAPLATLIPDASTPTIVTIVTNLPTTFPPTVADPYNGTVSYFCRYYNNPLTNSSILYYPSATKLSHNTYSCNVTRGSSQDDNKDISIEIWVSHVDSPDLYMPLLTKGSISALFLFMSQTATTTVMPFMSTYTLVPSNVIVSIQTQKDIISQEQLYCMYTSETDGTLFSKAAFANAADTRSRLITCQISKQYVTDSSRTNVVTVALVFRASRSATLPYTSLQSSDFVLSTNTLPFVYIRDQIAFDSIYTSDVTSGSSSGFLHWNEYGGQYVSFNFTTPNVTTLSYNVTMTSALKTYVMDCLFPTNAKASCTFTKVPFITIPTTLSFTLSLYDSLSRNSTFITMLPVMYYETQVIQTVYPFMMSYTQSIGAAPAIPVYATISSAFNTNDYRLYCKITRAAGMSAFVAATFNSTTTLYCPIKSFGIPENLTLSIYFTPSSNQNAYYSNRDGYDVTSSNVTLASNVATVFMLAPNDVALSNTQGLISNSTAISIPLVAPPTQLSQYSNYTMQLVIKDRGKATVCSCNPPSYNNMTWTLLCKTPVFDSSNFPSLPWRVSVDLLINNIFAITSSQFTYYHTSISSVNVLPIKFVPEVLSPQSLSKVIFNSTMNWVPKLNSATVRYSCTDCAVVDMTTYSCWYLNGYQLQCPSPQFAITNPSVSMINVDVKISFNGVDYQGLPLKTLTVYSTRTITITNVTSVNCRADTTSTFRLLGKNFFSSDAGESNNIVVIVYDAYISIQVAGTFVNSGAIDVTIPSLWHKNIVFPRQFYVSVSLDGGNYFFTMSNPLFTCAAIPSVTVSGPVLLPVSSYLTGLQIMNLPNLHTTLVGTQKKSLKIQLESETHTIEIQENSGTYESKGVIMPPTPQTMNLVLYLVISDVNGTISTTRAYVPVLGSITTYSLPSLNLETPSLLMVGSTLPIVLRSSTPIPSILAKSVQANFVASSRRIQATTWPLTLTQTTDYIYIYIDGANLKNDTTGMALQITFNNGYNWQTLTSTFSTMNSYYLTSVSNDLDGSQPSTYTFQTTPLDVFGRFPSTAITNLRLRTTLLSNYTILQPSTVSLQWKSSNAFSIMMPNISAALPFIDTAEARFPLVSYLGVSFNDYDYAEVPLTWLNVYRQPLITLVNPQVVPRFDYPLFCQGVYLAYINYCVFRYDAQNRTEKTPVVYPGNGTSFTCNLPLDYTLPGWQMTVSNEQTESATSFQIILYDPPLLLRTEPAIGLTQGGYQVNVFVGNYTQGTPLYLRVASTYMQNKCDVYDTSGDIAVFTCTMTSHDAGTFPLLISYNNIHYYSYGGLLRNESENTYSTYKMGDPGTFTFSACDAGYTAPDYSKNCTACPAGTYKPSIGTYDCIQCPNNTYSDAPGQTSCTICPSFTSTQGIGANTSYACVCTPGYYRTRDFVANYLNTSLPYFTPNTTLYDKRCTVCPPGGSCPIYNMTYPLAAYGYWHANYTGPGNDRFVFFKCFPAEACPGGDPENCTFGYQGVNCGLCLNDPRSTSTQFYKWQYKCQQCQEGTWWRLILFLLLIAGITVIFFVFSSIKITHLSSISIAFSFWQIISMFSHFDIQWPAAVSNTFTAASITNFNTDFLSPQCIIPQMSWQTKWVIQTILPFMFGVAFVVLYILGEIRSFILNRVGHFVPFKYWAFYEPQQIDELEETKYTTAKQRYWQLVKYFMGEMLLIVKNMLVWSRNFCVWFIKQGLTRYQMQTFRNKCINSYTAFLSFTFIFIMTQASEIFVCTQQPNGQFTLNNSPDIFCYGDASNGGWNYMLPATIIIYLCFGLGSLLFFIYVFIEKKRLMYGEKKIIKMREEVEETSAMIKKENNIVGDVELEELHDLEFGQELFVKVNKLEKYQKRIQNANKNFKERYRFLLLRFKRKLFYWEAVITARKLALSLLYTFLKPVQVVVFGIMVVFLALILHFNFVPFRQKFHNLIEYIVLLSTLIILFMGFLFFVDSFPADWLRSASVVLTVGIIVVCSVFIVLMVLVDLWTRRQKEQQKIREYRKRMEEEFGKNAAASLKKQYKSLFPSALSKMNRVIVDEEDDPNDPWTVEENPLMVGTEDPTYEIEYVHDEEDPWTIVENGLIEKPIDANIDEGEWIIVPNLLATDDKGESVYAGMSTRLTRVVFDLPFYASDEEDSDEDASNNVNDVIESLFKKERAKKRILAAKYSILKIVKRVKKAGAKEDQVALLEQ